jgi:hypothetical protein
MQNYKLILVLSLLLILKTGALAQPQQIVRVAPGYATVIICPAPPELVTVGNMDLFSVQSAGNYVLVKPLVDKGSTNMFIKAGSESYNLLVQITNKPDLEVRLPSSHDELQQLIPGNSETESEQDDETIKRKAALSRRKSLSKMQPQVLASVATLFKIENRYTYSVNNSKVILAVDHMKQIKDKLFLICTIVNNSNIPYDVGYVRFKLIDYARSYVIGRKKLKESEMEPTNEYFNSTIKPRSSGRLLFVFDKHGFSHRSTISIKCDEENGRRDLSLEVPGSMVQ